MEAIIKLRDMFNELYTKLTGTPLCRFPFIMHQHIDCTLIFVFF